MGKRTFHVDKQTGTWVETPHVLHCPESASVKSAFSKRPVRSIAMRVMPGDRPEFKKMVKESGVAGVELLPDGRPEFRSELARKKFFRYLKSSTGKEWHDKDSYC